MERRQTTAASGRGVQVDTEERIQRKKSQLIAAFVVVVATGILVVGYLFNMLM
jgi:hypothetical protein